ncbi:hypothetical protein K435DRAFT_607196, partial [Dendrothele bispora CBS 962.96]
QKFRARSSIASIMINAERERGGEAGVAFWSYVLEALSKLGPKGMSDEEDATVDVAIGELQAKQAVRLVHVLKWRHPDFRRLFEIVDKTPGMEDLIFSQTGKASLPRHRVDTESNRPPPKDLPKTFFKDDFFDGME